METRMATGSKSLVPPSTDPLIALLAGAFVAVTMGPKIIEMATNFVEAHASQVASELLETFLAEFKSNTSNNNQGLH